MKRLCLTVLLAVALAGTGCNGKGAGGEQPVTAPVVSDPGSQLNTPPANPAPPRVAHWEAELCTGTRTANERQGLLQAVLQAELKGRPDVRSGFSSSVLPKCILSSVMPGQDIVLLYGHKVMAGDLFAAVAWKVENGWQVAPVVPPPQGWGDIGRLTLHRAAVAGEKPVLLLTGASTDSSTWIRETALQGSLSEQGALQLRTVSDGYLNAVFDFLGPESLLLVTFQGTPPGELGWTCTNCIPVTRQELLRWGDSRFVKVAERTFLDPYATVNLFMGAVKANRQQEVDRFTAGPAAAAEILRMLGMANWGPGSSANTRTYWEAERWNWAELPASHRKDFPTALMNGSFELIHDGQSLWLDMVRQERGWVITKARSSR